MFIHSHLITYMIKIVPNKMFIKKQRKKLFNQRLKVTMPQFLHMDKRVQEKHTPWKDLNTITGILRGGLSLDQYKKFSIIFRIIREIIPHLWFVLLIFRSTMK
jgi:hypothetical protein